jgi:signal transduction histidine kinase
MGLLRHPTARMRLTIVYGALYVLISLGLLTIADVVFAMYPPESDNTTVNVTVTGSGSASALAGADARIAELQAQLAAATSLHSSEISLLATGSAIALVVMTAVSLGLGWGVAGRVLRPLRAMTAATRRISADSLHARLAAGGPRDELRDLSDTIDGLLERLEGSFAAQRRFAANAAHELRTPLATMRASLDVALAKPSPVPAVSVADRLYGELDRVDRLLDGLLTLARLQHGDLQSAVTLSLDAVAAASLAARAEAITARRLTVSLSGCPDGAWVTGNPELVCRMADNLVDNAIVHNEPGGWVRISVTAEDLVASLVVENGGEVIGADAVAQLAQPFRRLGVDRVGSDTGVGLGLSIVAAIAEAHRGTLELRARPDGGLRARIGLPSS